jgi:hypothetical protein
VSSFTEQQQIQKQRVIQESPPAINVFVQAIPLVFFGVVLFAVVVAAMPFIWDRGGFVGRLIDVLVVVLIVCLFGMLCIWMYTFAGRKWHEHYNVMLHRNIIHAGDVVIRVKPDGTYDHLSAEHMAASVIGQPKDEPMVLELDYQRQIKEMHDRGMGRETIAKALNWTPYQVRKVLENLGAED